MPNNDGLIDAGDTIQWEFELTNTGNVPLTNLAVADDVLASAGLSVTCPTAPLAPGASVICTAPVYVITAADALSGAVHNTAIANGEDPDGGDVPSNEDDTVTPTEVANPAIEVIKKINGDDANTAPGVAVAAGSDMSITFDVTNTGNVTLTNVQLSDDVVPAGAIVAPTSPANWDGSLTPGQTVTFTATFPAPATGGVLHTNTGTATGTPPNGGDVSDDDPANATTTEAPGITVVKKINGDDANTAPGVAVAAGSTMNITFDVTNTGNVTLTDVTLADDVVPAGAIVAPSSPASWDGSLTPGQTVTFTATFTAPTNGGVLHTNVGTATGTPPNGGPVTDDDPANATTTEAPAITVVKKINGDDANTAPGVAVASGSDMSITFDVTNTGNVALTDVTLADDVVPAGAIVAPTSPANWDGGLAPGATVTFTATFPAPATGGVLHTNVATATGTPPTGPNVTDDDPANATTTEAPAISVVKKINGDDANTAPGVSVATGSDMDITFDVTNTGNVTLTDVTLADDVIAGAAITPPAGWDGTLAPGETVQFAATIQAPANGGVLHTNVGTATGTPPTGTPVTDDDPGNATTTEAPAISVVKKINGDDANTAPGVSVGAGSTMNITFDVTNTGNVTLTDVTLADDVVPAGAIVAPTSPANWDGSLAPGATVQFTATFTAPANGGVLHTNTATATGTPPTGADVEDEDPANATTTEEPGLTLVKRVASVTDVNNDGLTNAGDTILWEFDLTNSGNVDLTELTVSDPLAGAVTCPTAPLAPGATVTCTANSPYVITTADEAAGSVVNVATSTGKDPGGTDVPSNPGTTTTPTEEADPAITVIKKINGDDANNAPGVSVQAGSDLAITFDVTNAGNVTLTEVTLTDDVVAGAAITPPAGWDGTLAPGETVQFAATIQAPAAGGVLHTNTGTATGTPPTGTPVTDEDPGNATTVEAPDFTFVKSVLSVVDVNDNGLTDAGDEINYGFTFRNTGNVTLTDVVVNDPLLGGVTCEVTTLAAGASTSCVADEPYVITAADVHAGSVHNVATATGTPPNQPPLPPKTGETDTPTDQVGELELVKRIDVVTDVNDNGLVDAGDLIEYGFTVTNTGTVTLSGVVVDDPLLGGVTCEVMTLAAGASTDCVGDEAYVVTAADVEAGEVVNTATATGTTPQGPKVDSPPATVIVETDEVPPTMPPSVDPTATEPPSKPSPSTQATVDTQPPAAGHESLADTGGPAVVLTIGGLGTLLAGLAVVTLGRRRRADRG